MTPTSQEVLASQETARGSAALPAGTWDVKLSLADSDDHHGFIPGMPGYPEIEAPVLAAPEEGEPAQPGILWHQARTYPGITVRVMSSALEKRTVWISAQSEAPGWQPRWIRWNYVTREPGSSLEGTALAAQDELAPDGSWVKLQLQPGETRYALLEVHVRLQEDTYPGNYPMQVVASGSVPWQPEGTPRNVPSRRRARTSSAEEAYLDLDLRLRHPPATWLNYLPAIYAETLHAQHPAYHDTYQDLPFFERFLRGFEDVWEPTRAQLRSIHEFLDPDSSPADFLPWLATWVSMVLDENWPELKRRLLIKEAVDLYRRRGTRPGLSRYLEIYTGVKPEIRDRPSPGIRLGRGARLGKGTRLGGIAPHTFVVGLAVPDPASINEQIVREIIEANKPAHAAYDLRIMEQLATPSKGATVADS